MGFLDWVRGVNEKLEPQGATTTPAVPTENDILNALERTEQMARDARLHPFVLARVSRVARLVRQTLPRVKSTGLGTSESYAVMATATDYLPEALGGYLRLPRDWADNRPIENGKTSLMLLIDQLDLLGATMDKIFDAANRADAEALIAHGRFLTARFGHESTGGELDLEAGAGPIRPTPPMGSGPTPGPVSSNPLDLP
jgi:hypothetical protein